jgi:LuxR family transcriptional regulator
MFQAIDAAARQLGFEHCALVQRSALPLTQPRTRQLSSQPAAWQHRYAQAGYITVDPAVRQSSASEAPQLWSDLLFAPAPAMWSEAQAAGLRHGWTQSSLDCIGVGSILSLSRSAEPITVGEVRHKQASVRELVEFAHAAQAQLAPTVELTAHQKQVLRWTADGKTAQQIADRLDISVHTVHFHLKQCATKLQTASKSAMVARALALHLLDPAPSA